MILERFRQAYGYAARTPISSKKVCDALTEGLSAQDIVGLSTSTINIANNYLKLITSNAKYAEAGGQYLSIKALGPLVDVSFLLDKIQGFYSGDKFVGDIISLFSNTFDEPELVVSNPISEVVVTGVTVASAALAITDFILQEDIPNSLKMEIYAAQNHILSIANKPNFILILERIIANGHGLSLLNFSSNLETLLGDKFGVNVFDSVVFGNNGSLDDGYKSIRLDDNGNEIVYVSLATKDSEGSYIFETQFSPDGDIVSTSLILFDALNNMQNRKNFMTDDFQSKLEKIFLYRQEVSSGSSDFEQVANSFH